MPNLWCSCLFVRAQWATIQSPGGGGGGVRGCSFCREHIIYFNQAQQRVEKFLNFITCLYRTVLEVNYLFHAGSVRNYLFQK